MTSPTLSQYGDFQAAFEHFNMELFSGALPDTMLTLARTRHASGYVIPEGFTARAGEDQTPIPEIGLNPKRFGNRTAEQVLGALVVEMIKLAQHAAGTDSPDNYLNKDFHARAAALGLDYSGMVWAEAGPFHCAAVHLIAQGWQVNYVAPSVTEDSVKRQTSKKASKTKYTCPVTGLNAWAKPGAKLYTQDARGTHLMIEEA